MAERCSVEITIYRAMLFDMDGVITDTMPFHFEACKRAFEPYGISVSREDVYLREGMATSAMGEEIARAKGKEPSGEDLKKIVAAKTGIFNDLAIGRAKAYDGVPETLRMLRGNGIRLALVTGSKAHLFKLSCLCCLPRLREFAMPVESLSRTHELIACL